MQPTFTPKYTFGEYEGRLLLLLLYIYTCVRTRTYVRGLQKLCFCVFVFLCANVETLVPCVSCFHQ